MKKYKILFLIIFILLLFSCNKDYDISDNEKSIPPFENGNFIVELVEGEIELFNSISHKMVHFNGEANVEYIFEVKNNTEKTIYFEIYFNLPYEISEVFPDYLEPQKSTYLKVNFFETGNVCLGITLLSEKINLHFPIDTVDFISLVQGEKGADSIVYLRSDLIFNDLILNKPFTLDCNGYKFIANRLVFESGSAGIMTFVTQENFDVEKLFFNTPDWDVLFDVIPQSLNDEEVSFYAHIKTLNGIIINNDVITVKSLANWLDLLDTESLPAIRKDTFIRLDGGFQLLPYDMQEYLYIIDIPISLEFADVDIAGVRFRYETDKTGTININIKHDYPIDFITFKSPLCDVNWDNCNYLSIDNFYFYTNINTFNGIKPAVRLGGLGEGEIIGVTDNNENIDFSVTGFLIKMNCKYSVLGEKLKKLEVEFNCGDNTAFLSGEHINNDGTYDLSEDRLITVTDKNGGERIYYLKIETVKNLLPVIYLTTNNNVEIISKEDYVNGTFSMNYDDFNIGITNLRIRGRGNSTWTMPKKPFRLKFDKKISLFGQEANKDWVLLANYADKSSVRNLLALELGLILNNMPYTSFAQLVDVFMNGEYIGVYTLTEQVEVAAGRIEISEEPVVDTGYLIEIGGTNDDDVYNKDYFHAGTLKFALVKSPENLTSEQFEYIRDYCLKADEAVKNLEGYEEYIDIPSLIDWFILHELSYNIDNCFRRSCFFTKNPGGKLIMGPPWDFDLAFGNIGKGDLTHKNWASVGADTDDSYVKITWMNYLMEDPKFVEQLKNRWAEVGELLLEKSMEIIDLSAKMLEDSQIENFKIWQVMGSKVPYESPVVGRLKSYDEHIEYLKNFIKTRKAWIDTQLK